LGNVVTVPDIPRERAAWLIRRKATAFIRIGCANLSSPGQSCCRNPDRMF
jgi:hypothetical protein